MSNAMYLGTTIDRPPLIAFDKPLFDHSRAARGVSPADLLDLQEDAPVWGLDIPGLADLRSE